ncbi:DeoR/GlpR family DNA-binding transcription regulator [Paenibacillus sp. MCAF20]
MLVAERYDKIVQLVNERGSIRVTELSELCQVTEETIRRDLDRLEQAGRLRRSHGGAVSVKDQHLERGVSESNELQARIKQKMVGMADQVILLADSSKFGVIAFTNVAELGDIDTIVTDKRLSGELLSQLEERQIAVTIV